MEITEIILQEVRQVRSDLNEHVQGTADRQNTLYRELHDLRTQTALNKQQGNALIAFISTVISGAVAWMVTYLGGRG